jgi:hypothetical protein
MYNLNRKLIDLRAQPEELKNEFKKSITECVNKPRIASVGVHLMKFCSKWDLKRILDNVTSYARVLNSYYEVKE